MKRKQYYITEEQDILIKEKALEWKISEAEIIRKKIDELQETGVAEIRPDTEKFLMNLKEAEKLRKSGHFKIGKFERDKLYEDVPGQNPLETVTYLNPFVTDFNISDILDFKK